MKKPTKKKKGKKRPKIVLTDYKDNMVARANLYRNSGTSFPSGGLTFEALQKKREKQAEDFLDDLRRMGLPV